MDPNILKDKWALVTGASSGLGADFARILASMDCNLIITSRRQELLEVLKKEIIDQFGISVKVIPLDLSVPESPKQLYDQILSQGIQLEVLINNAGFGIFGEFLEVDWEKERKMLQLNILAVVQLTKLFARDMVSQGSGYILQIASNSAYQPSPLYATYGACKSFVLNFSEALSYELRSTKVKCTTLSPATIPTEFHKVSGQPVDSIYFRLSKMESLNVARIGIKAMLKGRPSKVPGGKIALTAWLNQRAPRRWATAIAEWMMRI
jgi:short-subunit dehydrogenase